MLLPVAFLLLAAASARGLEPLGPPGAPGDAFPAPNRPVAGIVSPIWATEKERDAADESGQIIRRLGIEPGMTVADLGAGSGYHTVRLARALGRKGRVLAQDVTPRYLERLAKRVRDAGLTNVTLGLGEPHDPRLPPNSVDVALLAHVYHEIAQPFAFLHNLAPTLKSGGRLAIVELDRETRNHGMPRELLRCELAAMGYKQLSISKLRGNIGYLAVFARLPPRRSGRRRQRSSRAPSNGAERLRDRPVRACASRTGALAPPQQGIEPEATASRRGGLHTLVELKVRAPDRSRRRRRA